ncbi:universal stress protein [Ramlibacter algicola]|uniref:Universal stress protein n=1 Tax=Ramlibacter algicola TaxID=2795217 RepID=A0A934Q2T4_9BURK|nr:universal stress protein [Ramlibacter algicola]MBK0393916.1 universal stress protein [Ramlibacter algicola]
MYSRLLVTTDGSDLSAKALQAAIDLATAMRAELVVLHVVPLYPTSYFEGAIAYEHGEIARIERQWGEQGQALVDQAAAQADAAGVKARGVILRSDLVADSVIAAATKYECDLVVMASHGRRGIGRVLLGSETLHVLTHSTVPVLVLR